MQKLFWFITFDFSITYQVDVNFFAKIVIII